MERMPSIFNDVLSPVTPGPSSSNTCGPYRIARLARALLGEMPRHITVRMARRGGYYDTFYSMHSHEAILAALLGQELLRCDLSTMCRQADEAGLCYDFQFVDDLPVRPSELAEMDAYARDTGRPLWRVAFDYESALTGATEAELRAYARQVLDICRHARQQGVRPDNHFIGVTDARAARYKALREGRKLIDLGAADEACLDAMSIMEFSNAHGTIVCMPTGGASGIVPAAVYRIGERLGKTETEQENALLVAGLIGAFYYPTHYTGAIGCQAEIGVAVSMASAALCSMMTDDPDTIHCAASLGGQVLMGLLCNPIEGYVQVPCIVRNMAAVPTAVTCANAALAGMDHIVPLDNVVALMLAVGEKIRPCDEAGTYILEKEEE